MAEPKKPINFFSTKFLFFYFMVFSIIVLIIFLFVLTNSYWNYWQGYKQTEKYYFDKIKALSQNFPQLNATDPILGPPDAKVTIFEYTDIFCSTCQNTQNEINNLLKFYGLQIRLVFKGLPLTIQTENRPSLLAAYCANEQNKFWDYLNLLYQNSQTLNLIKYREFANQLNLDLNKFNACLTENKYNNIINNTISEALKLKITTVPTIYINEKKVEGLINFENLRNIIDEKLR